MTVGTLVCAECDVEMTTADAEMAVVTDAGPVHQECFEGPVPLGSTGREAIEMAEEEEARERHGDVSLPLDCIECHAEPSIRGGRGLLCRGRSML